MVSSVPRRLLLHSLVHFPFEWREEAVRNRSMSHRSKLLRSSPPMDIWIKPAFFLSFFEWWCRLDSETVHGSPPLERIKHWALALKAKERQGFTVGLRFNSQEEGEKKSHSVLPAVYHFPYHKEDYSKKMINTAGTWGHCDWSFSFRRRGESLSFS